MMNILNGGAHADSSVDFQEFMVMPRRRRIVRRSAARGRRNLPRAARHPEGARPVDRRRRRRRLRAEPEVEPRSGRSRARGDRQGRAEGRPGRLHRARRRVERAVGRRRAATRSRNRASRIARSEEMIRALRGLAPAVPDRLDRGRPRRRRLGRLAAADRARSATRVQLVGDDVFVTNPEILKRASPTASATRCSSS